MFEFAIVVAVILFLFVLLGYKRPDIALIAAPFAAFAVGYAAVVTEREENIIFAPTLLIVTLVAIAASKREAEAEDWFHRWAFWFLVAIMVLLLIGLLLLAFWAVGAGFVLPVFFLLGASVIVVCLIGYGIGSRRAATAHVFSVIGSSMRQNLPLPMALDCAAAGRQDSAALALRRIKTWLVKGYSLAEAVRRGYPQCSAQALAMLSAGERVHQLPAAVEAIEKDLTSRSTERTRLRPVHPLYPMVVLAITFLFVWGLLTFVVPQYEAVLDEMMAGPLPASTEMLIRITRVIVYDANPWLLLALAVLVPGVVWVRCATRGRRPDRPPLLSRIGDALKWRLPILHWFANNRSMLQVVELLRMSLHTGTPLNEAIRSTLTLDVNLSFRRRLACWLERVERGEPVAQAARRCGLGAGLAWAFDSANADHVPAVLDLLESHHRSNYSYRVNLARFILWPLGIIVLGATVGCVIYALFAPGVAVLKHLSEAIYP